MNRQARDLPHQFYPRHREVWFSTSTLLVVVMLSAMLPYLARAAEAEGSQGLSLTFKTDAGNDITVSPNLWLHVAAGEPPSPFVAPGRFTALWEGLVSVDLRADFTFHAVVAGEVRIEVNGSVALEAANTKGEPVAGKPVRLTKGANAIKVSFTSPATGDSTLRVLWSSDEVPIEPIDSSALKFLPTPEFEKAAQRHRGRELFLKLRCAKCHTPSFKGGVPELAMDAPSFEGIGSRRNVEWMSKWILNPTQLRPGAQMPTILHGASASSEAEAIAHYLASLKASGAPAVEEKSSTADAVDAGRKLFAGLHCVACHDDPSSPASVEGKISLKWVGEKFSSGALASFLRSPHEHFRWIRMPNFKFTIEESSNLAAFLLASSPTRTNAVSVDPARVEKGKELVQTRGCQSCHGPGTGNRHQAPELDSLKGDGLQKHCLASAVDPMSRSPRFALAEVDRLALRMFLEGDRLSLQRHVPVEFAERHTRLLQCTECHGKFDGFPVLPIVGEKLRPEWMRSFIAGEVSYKPRPWIESRMPGFKAYAEAMGTGLAHRHGYAGRTSPDSAVDEEAATQGRRLVSSDGGFSCISCHGVAAMAPTQVFESAGINLAYASERLQIDYFRRWLLNPLRVDPQTKMPVYFDQGKSPLTEVYEGDAAKQLRAIWHYILLGSKMPPPIANAEAPK